MSLKEKHNKLKTGELTCQESVESFMKEINKLNSQLNIFLDVNDQAVIRAKQLDEKRNNKKNLGKLFGLVYSIKSNISVQNLNISCASNTLENYKGSFNADVIEKILDEDGIIIGIVNNDEFANGISGETSSFGKTINPKSEKRVPGGSSSGSAASVAANLCDISLGSDTGGSIRNPASHCGVLGIKPSYGRVSRYGLIDLSMSLDQIGPLSRDSYGAAITMSVISGKSSNDPITIDSSDINFFKEPTNKLKIGIVKDFYEKSDSNIQKVYDETLKLLKNAGHDIKEVNIDKVDLSIQAYYPIVYTEFYSGTRKFDGLKYGKSIQKVAGEEVLRRISGGEQISQAEFDGAYYKKALKVKEILGREFDRVFKEVDVILTPVTPKLPHKFKENLTPEESYNCDAFTTPANLAGICAASVPRKEINFENESIPIGIQLMANRNKEDYLFEAIRVLEQL